jgi:hypothetical protein
MSALSTYQPHTEIKHTAIVTGFEKEYNNLSWLTFTSICENGKQTKYSK